MSNILSLTSPIYLILAIAAIVGALFVFKRGAAKATNEAMELLNDTLNKEIVALRRRVDDLEKERATQDRVIATIRYALKQYRLKITIAGDVVTIHAPNGTSQSVPVQDRAQIKPILTGTSEDEDA